MNDERPHVAKFRVWLGFVVGKRVGGLVLPSMRDYAREVGPA
jgi:hypothetical protein